jgi:hypothetical protein
VDDTLVDAGSLNNLGNFLVRTLEKLVIPAPLINFYGGMISPLNQAQVQGICPLPHLPNLCLCETGW